MISNWQLQPAKTKIYDKPFKHIIIENFLKEEKANQLLIAIKKQKFYLEDHDLYQFLRTHDFENTKNKTISEFRQFLLDKESIQFIEKTTKAKLSTNKISLHSLKMQNTHYLLCHDDEVQKRKIAFILYLNEEKFSQKDGGQLQLFDSENKNPTKIAKEITPEFNKLVLFEVTPGKSFHQISEILTDKQRISISGWYYEE